MGNKQKVNKSKTLSNRNQRIKRDMIMNSNNFLKFSLKLTRMCINREFQTSCVMQKISVGRYKVTKDKSNPLTYEQSVKPEWIGFRKGGHSHNTGQLEGTFLKKEEIGQDLPHKLLIEDLFIRKFIVGTFPNQLGSEVNKTAAQYSKNSFYS